MKELGVEINGITFINLTPHDIHLHHDDERTAIDTGTTIPRTGWVARVETEMVGQGLVRKRICKYVHVVKESGASIHIADLEFLHPQRQTAAYYIVSTMVLECADRLDFVAPAGDVRDDDGRIIGCTYFVR